MAYPKIINEGGITGTGEGLVNQNSEEFKELQRIIRENAANSKDSELIFNQLLSLRFQMENYLNSEDPVELKSAGKFLEEFVEAIGIKKKSFAEYIDYKESNLSAIFKGRRKINSDLAIKFGEIFNVDAVMWLQVQNKNELIEVFEENKVKYRKYKLVELLKSTK